MPTTLNKLSHQVIRLLEAGPKTRDSKLSHKYIQTEINQVVNKLLKTQWYEDKNTGADIVNHMMLATYTGIEVQEDSDRGKCYAELPAFPINLPNNLGIQEVKPYTDDPGKNEAMIPLAYGELDLMKSLNVGIELIDDQFAFEVKRDRVEFTEKDGLTILEHDIEEVEMTLVVNDTSSLDEDDPYPIPASMEVEVIREVLMLHGYTGKEVADLLNDGNPQSR